MCKFYLKGNCSSSQMSAYYFPIEKGKISIAYAIWNENAAIRVSSVCVCHWLLLYGDCTCKSSIYSMPAIRNHRIVLVCCIPDIILDYFVPVPWGENKTHRTFQGSVGPSIRSVGFDFWGKKFLICDSVSVAWNYSQTRPKRGKYSKIYTLLHRMGWQIL